MVFVLDASALHAVPAACGGVDRCGPFLTDLSAALSAEEIAFCRDTVKELKILASGAPHHAWAAAEMKSMWGSEADWANVQTATNALSAYVDLELLDSECEMLSVIALCLCLQAGAHEVTVVSEDHHDKPGLASMWTACGVMGLDVCSLDEFAGVLGLDHHLV
ncbi:MAG: hypothetical protein AAGC53_03610 [Actinomycetota bacterium]